MNWIFQSFVRSRPGIVPPQGNTFLHFLGAFGFAEVCSSGRRRLQVRNLMPPCTLAFEHVFRLEMLHSLHFWPLTLWSQLPFVEAILIDRTIGGRGNTLR
jgi:hypothetical protein